MCEFSGLSEARYSENGPRVVVAMIKAPLSTQSQAKSSKITSGSMVHSYPASLL
jgi:hypothetical protein